MPRKSKSQKLMEAMMKSNAMLPKRKKADKPKKKHK